MVKYGIINNKIIIEMAFTDNNMEKFTYKYFNDKGLHNIQINILQQNKKDDISINENLNECKLIGGDGSGGGDQNSIYLNNLNNYLIMGGTGSLSKVIKNMNDAKKFKQLEKIKNKELQPQTPPLPPQTQIEDNNNDNAQIIIAEKFLKNHNNSNNNQYKIQLIIPTNNNDLYIIEALDNSIFDTNYKKYKEHLFEEIELINRKQKVCNPIILKSKKNLDFEIIIGEIVLFNNTKIETSNKYKGTQINKIAENS